MISVVLATYQRPERIREAVARFADVTAPEGGYEIVVVDDGSAPALDFSTLAGPPGVPLKTLRVAHGGVGAARNAGAAVAAGSCLAFAADDCTPERDWLQVIARRHAANPECAIGGVIVHGLPNDPYSTAADLLIRYMRQRFNADPRRATFFTPNNLAVPTALFREIGGFDPQFNPAGEDRDFCARWVEAGYAMISNDEMRVVHRHPLTLWGFLRMQYIHGRGSMQFRRVRAERLGGAVRMEAAGFYTGLLRFAMRQTAGIAALLVLSQIAVAAGAARALLRQR